MRASSRADLVGRQHEVDAPAATTLRGMLVCSALSSCAKVMPPAALISCMPERAVVARARQDHADRLVAVLFGERAHEVVDRAVLPARSRCAVRAAAGRRRARASCSAGSHRRGAARPACRLRPRPPAAAVARDRISGSMLAMRRDRGAGSRRWPCRDRVGSAPSRSPSAFSPPAEAPMHTIGNGSPVSGVACCSIAGLTPGSTGSWPADGLNAGGFSSLPTALSPDRESSNIRAYARGKGEERVATTRATARRASRHQGRVS